MAASTRSSSSGGGASSISTREDRVSIRRPAPTIATATTSAAIGSNTALPVIATRPRPRKTPAEVSASVRRWAASPSSAAERSARARRPRYAETPKFATAEKPITANPTPSRSTSAPTTRRCVAS